MRGARRSSRRTGLFLIFPVIRELRATLIGGSSILCEFTRQLQRVRDQQLHPIYRTNVSDYAGISSLSTKPLDHRGGLKGHNRTCLLARARPAVGDQHAAVAIG